MLGLIDTSCYVRGQYTFIDTIPLVRRAVKLFPPGSGVEDNGPSLDSLASPVSDLSPTSGATGWSSSSPASPTVNESPKLTAYRDANGMPLAPTVSKHGQAYLTPGMVFPFSIIMPNKHYRDDTVELPPSCEVVQDGMQVEIEYVLRIELARKGWRLNER